MGVRILTASNCVVGQSEYEKKKRKKNSNIIDRRKKKNKCEGRKEKKRKIHADRKKTHKTESLFYVVKKICNAMLHQEEKERNKK